MNHISRHDEEYDAPKEDKKLKKKLKRELVRIQCSYIFTTTVIALRKIFRF